MERRSFFKILSTVSAGIAASSCGKKSDTLIPMLVADREIPPGEERWHPAVCTECNAGCGTIMRVMEGERIVERNGAEFRERIACIKKIEGNPLDPVSGGRLCARGQAAVQGLYNPDRVQGPLRRSGARGKAEFAPISWDEAISAVTEKLAKARASDPGKIVFLTRPQIGIRTINIQKFLAPLGAPPAFTCSLASFAPERKAAESVFGWKGIPRYDLANARYALGVGADFLGGWVSPVYYARQFGQFRQGRAGIRGKLVQAESRMSLTGQSADEWVPIRPGSEAQFLIAISRFLLEEKLARNASQLPSAVMDSIEAADIAALIRTCGIDEKRLRRVARELGESEGPLVIAGASIVHANSANGLAAAHFLNLMLGNVGKPGGVFPSNESQGELPQSNGVIEALKRADVLLLDHENPVYSLPVGSGVGQALSRTNMIVSFGSFIDDSSAYADFILPDHHGLESDTAVVPAVSPQRSFTVSMSLVRPLYNTRSLEQSLGDIAKKMNVAFESTDPKSYVGEILPRDQTWDQVARQGGLWTEGQTLDSTFKAVGEKLAITGPVLVGHPEQFPLHFQPYLSTQFHDGSGANLPWMQELPDPTSSAMWCLPVEIDPKTAAQLKIETGDWVRVESPHGSLEAQAYVHPAAIPGVVSMAIGQGHAHYGRYASGRGANPISILAPILETTTGVLAFGDTRVRVARLERKPEELIQFSPQDREQGPWGYR